MDSSSTARARHAHKPIALDMRAEWLALAIALRVVAADVTHHRHGNLEPYRRQPPSRYGLLASAEVALRLRRRKAYISKIDLPNGFRQTNAIKDVDAPASIVFEQIVDLSGYPDKIDGVIATDIYRDERGLDGVRTVCALYKVRFAAFTAKSHVEHEIDPFMRCMTFKLDKRRPSDVSEQSRQPQLPEPYQSPLLLSCTSP